MTQPKIDVIKRFLAFVSQYIPLAEARLATLGGQGFESEAWRQSGVKPENGWLIERQKRLSRHLVANQPYHYCASLEALPEVIRSVYGKQAGIDAFHLDLCGTLEPNLAAFQPVMRLIASRSRGRCLAITVADQRRNLALEKFDSVYESIVKLTGKHPAKELFTRLLQQQGSLPRQTDRVEFFEPADPVKCAKREFGFFACLLELFFGNNNEPAVLPDRLERYIYVSRLQGRPFRMRTFFFHFPEQAKRFARKQGARVLAQQWTQSAIQVFHNGSWVTLAQQPQQPYRKEKPMQYPKLTAIAQAVGGEVQKEFDQLRSLAESAEAAQKALQQIKHLINGARPNEEASVVSSTDAPAAASGNSNVTVQMNLLRAKASGSKKALEDAYGDAYVYLGLNIRKHANDRRRIVGALLARTQGKFRSDFVARAVRTFGENCLAELTDLYSKSGKPVGVSELRKEAGLN